MTSPRTIRRTSVGIGTLLLAVGALSGCSPEPEPTPTATAAFASEEDAFAAAEEVYRAYTDAVNMERKSDSTADSSSYLVGSALDGSLDTANRLHAAGWRIIGDSQVMSFTGEAAELGANDVIIRAQVCLDVSATAVVDTSGADITPADRAVLVPLDVAFVESGSGLVISESNLNENSPC